MSGLREIDTYRTYLKQHKASLEGLESSEVASTVDKMQDLREGLTSSLTLMRCEDTLRDLDRVTQSLFVSSSETLSMPPFSTLLQHVEDPSLLLRRALIVTAEGAWDAQLWSLRMLGCGVSTVHACIVSLPLRSSHHISPPLHFSSLSLSRSLFLTLYFLLIQLTSKILCSHEIPRRPMCPAVVAYLRVAGTAILSIAAHTQFVVEVKPVPGSDATQQGTGGLNGIESLR